MQTTATKYLFKQLVKTKRVAESPAFIQFKESKKLPLDAPQSTAEANVLARLYKSNPVKNLLPGIMEGFRKVLGLEDATGRRGGNETEEGPTGWKKSQKGDGKKISKSKEAVGDAVPEDEDEDVDMNREDAGSEDEEFAQFDSRLAGSNSEDDDEGASNKEDPNDSNDPMSITPSASPSPSPSLEPDHEPQPQPQPTKKPKQTKEPPAPPTATTFLPSLAMGGYISGSDSDSDPDAEADATQPVRKNRMGQQARRALWEKKYGARANHVKKEKEGAKRDRDRGWDVRRGATDSAGSAGAASASKEKKGEKRREREFQGQQQQQQQLQRREEKKVQDGKPLHPSWEAARKAKEQQKTTQSFQGKKVTFG